MISFKDKKCRTNELYYNNKILKIADYIKLLNCFFIKSIMSKLCPKKQVKLILIQLDMLLQTAIIFIIF